MGEMVDRVRRELTNADIATIADTYHAWRGEPDAPEYKDVQGFAKAAELDEIRKHGHVLTPGRYVRAADPDEDDLPFAARFVTLKARLEDQFSSADILTATIRDKLATVGHNA
jgi:type I restriction enzyme M protein